MLIKTVTISPKKLKTLYPLTPLIYLVLISKHLGACDSKYHLYHQSCMPESHLSPWENPIFLQDFVQDHNFQNDFKEICRAIACLGKAVFCHYRVMGLISKITTFPKHSIFLSPIKNNIYGLPQPLS